MIKKDVSTDAFEFPISIDKPTEIEENAISSSNPQNTKMMIASAISADPYPIAIRYGIDIR